MPDDARPVHINSLRSAAAAVLIGLGMRWVVGLEPVGWLAWLVPGLLLALAYRHPSPRPWVLLAAVIGTSANLPYFRSVMPLGAALGAVAGQALLWAFVVLAARRVVLRYRAAWTVLAYPVLWVGADTLMAAWLPDGNWGSLAYSQAHCLPLLQLTALLGVPGLLFLLTLGHSALALALTYGRRLPGAAWAYVVPVALVAAALGYGTWRLRQPLTGPVVTFGLAAIDDAIGPRASASYTAKILRQYERHVATLAAQGAQVVVLPEKIGGLLTATQAQQWQRQLSGWAASYRVWLEAGVGVAQAGGERRNLAWLFAPDGKLRAEYQKQHLAPPEREFAPGLAYTVDTVAGQPMGLAVCKDMHFAAFGRAYGRRASVLLVPAWDFYRDRQLAERMTATRGVENGYLVVRASREGLLTVSDAYGRVVAERPSRGLPGQTLLVRTRVAPPVPTLYTRLGDGLGWLCVAAGAGLLLIGRGAPKPPRGVLTA